MNLDRHPRTVSRSCGGRRERDRGATYRLLDYGPVAMLAASIETPFRRMQRGRLP